MKLIYLNFNLQKTNFYSRMKQLFLFIYFLCYFLLTSCNSAIASHCIHVQVGNKCDESPSVREVSMSEGAAEAANWGCGFLETSAKTNHNVDTLFRDLLTLEKNRSVSLQPVQSNNAIRLKEKCAVM